MSINYGSAPAGANRFNRKPLLACCGVLLLFGALGVIGAVSLFKSGSKSVAGAQVAADRFLAALEHQDYPGAYRQMTRQTQASASVNSIRDVMEVVQQRRGPALRHAALPGFYINSYNGVTQVRVAYREEFKTGQTSVQRMLLQKQGQ